MDDPSDVTTIASQNENISTVAQWRAAKHAASYLETADHQARSAAQADVEDRVMEWCEGIAAEAWDDL
ncbi:hypothetical protein U0C82_11735 [Fulvimarina sp. 2208YS6-2-32]|uniref:Uncharacterized protein n=1 Tax=Fulvimarina uroteuthidis TaxID=3098149 RepID=A0ABU5I4T6_9HYPH|nr:hypothetical protein [Fulvimarina sp. 2208YS6-2-32]MDY8109809.1 hypothetical protein [Fulvimarina sp. 2208YS6-2-32]